MNNWFGSVRFYDHITGYGKMAVGFAVGHVLQPFRDPWLDTIAALVGLSLWGIGTYGVGRQDGQEVVSPVLERAVPINSDGLPKGFVTLSTDRSYASNSVQVVERDPRLMRWAQAIVDGQPMTQAKWAGGKRPFSKPEYEAWIKQLLERGVIAPKNAKSNNSGFKPSGAAGWQYIKSLADGREYLPLPQIDRSKSEHLWVRA